MRAFKYFIIACLLHSLNVNAQSFSGSIGGIPDKSKALFTTQVSHLLEKRINKLYGLQSVCLTIEHPYDQNLIVTLFSPNGTQITLFKNVGGSADNFVNTCFRDDDSLLSISNGEAQFTGTFRPQTPLGRMNNNQFGEGVWTLQVEDDGLNDVGTLLSWQLNFGYDAPQDIQLNSNLPIILINTKGQVIKDSGNRVYAAMTVIDNVDRNRNTSVDTNQQFSGNIDIGIRGHFSATLPQVPYSITTYTNALDNDTNVSLLTMPKEHDWILQATYNDKSFIRNTLMYELSREMGHYAARTQPCELILDGNYIGIYLLTEKIKVDSNRVNILKMKTSNLVGDSVTGGYIFSHDYKDKGWTSVFAPSLAPTKHYFFNYEYPKAKNIQSAQQDYLKLYIDSFQQALYSHQFSASKTYRDFIDMPSFIDYLLCGELSWNSESFVKSMFFHKNINSINGKLFAGPIWDFDFALKRNVYTTPTFSGWNFDIESYGDIVATLPWWKEMMLDEEFKNEVRCRWETLRGGALKIKNLNARIDSLASIFNEAQQRHFTTWPILGISVGTPELPPFANTYQEEINYMKDMLTLRIAWIDKNLGGTCSIYYTDPTVVVYPNPANDLAYAEVQLNPIDEEEKPIQITSAYMNSLNGSKLPLNISIMDAKKILLDIHHIKQGVYILTLVNSDGRTFKGKFEKL